MKQTTQDVNLVGCGIGFSVEATFSDRPDMRSSGLIQSEQITDSVYGNRTDLDIAYLLSKKPIRLGRSATFPSKRCSVESVVEVVVGAQ
jgi:hypothetical protein